MSDQPLCWVDERTGGGTGVEGGKSKGQGGQRGISQKGHRRVQGVLDTDVEVGG